MSATVGLVLFVIFYFTVWALYNQIWKLAKRVKKLEEWEEHVKSQ